ncbi:MAG: NADPH:quinone reductase [Pseudonocardia sp. SCN 72-86]|nr:MAG: NADPH:quinone reductase [Pseudonocardia sp. SCN 72-86]
MKAIVQDRYGSPDVLRLDDVAVPEPGPGEVRVLVRASSVNAADWHVMRGDPLFARLALPSVFGMSGPRHRIRGRDVAGLVDAVGAGVTRLRPGDAVHGDLGDANGAFAEYACVSEDLLDHKPASLDFEHAAAVPLAGATALVAVRDVCEVRPGMRLAVNGASGGVGTFAVQIAVAAGAEVTAVCSARNATMVGDLGAHRVVDYRTQDFTTTGPFDAVLDLVGNRRLRDLRRATTPEGTIVLSGGGVSRGRTVTGPMGLIITGKVVAPFVSQRVVDFTVVPDRAHLATLRGMIDDGRVRPVVDRTYPLSDAAAAIHYMETQHARAKVVLTV